jgi:septal ring factor EnvC (AmiA/AmiB activator)
MDRKDKKIQKENIATRNKGLIIIRELEQVVRAFNKVLKDKDDRAKSIEGDLQELGKTLQENLDGQYEIDRNFDMYNNNIEKIVFNLQQLEDEEKTQAGRYERLLNGIGIGDENQESGDSLADDAIPAENENHDLDSLNKLRKRREKFIQKLNQEFKILEEKLSSIGKLKKELEDSRDEIGEKRAHTIDKKKVLEEEGKKLLNEVGRLESELETIILEEKNLIEESVKMIKRVESCLELDEKIDHVLFSSQTFNESAETSPASGPSGNGHKIAVGT